MEPPTGELVDREPELARRAAGRARRWMRANRCAYLWTFTFREAIVDWAQLALAVDQLLRRLRESAPHINDRRQKIALILVPEPHPGGHGWHVHGATNVYFPHKKMAELWGQGFVFVTRPRSGRRAWSPRTLSRYLAKYLGKSLGDEELHGCSPRPAGAHRYWVTQGQNPEALRSSHASREAALAYLRALYGREEFALAFGDDDGCRVPGIWLDYPDWCIARWEQRVKAESRAQRGQP